MLEISYCRIPQLLLGMLQRCILQERRHGLSVSPQRPPSIDFAEMTQSSHFFYAQVLCDGLPTPGILVGFKQRVGPHLNSPIDSKKQKSGHDGRVRFKLKGTPKRLTIRSLDCWPTAVEDPVDNTKINTAKVPNPKTNSTGWWHSKHLLKGYDATLGRGIRVGVVDTGLGEHRTLSHAKYYRSSINPITRIEEFIPAKREDQYLHGTAVCSLICSIPQSWQDYAGMSPGVELICIGASEGKDALNSAKIANGIEFLAREQQCDLINLSLILDDPNAEAGPLVEQAIERAFDVGSLSICAAGNNGKEFVTDVGFPAKMDLAVAVAALGLDGSGPPCVPSPSKPQIAAHLGLNGHYLADFSSWGEGIYCGAYGVGIIGAVDESFSRDTPYMYVDGTSFACPLAVGVLAAHLSEDEHYLGMPRGASKAQFARELLQKKCRDIGLGQTVSGYGLPTF